jgi:hypothetical protein
MKPDHQEAKVTAERIRSNRTAPLSLRDPTLENLSDAYLDLLSKQERDFQTGIEVGEIGADQNWHKGFNAGYEKALSKQRERDDYCPTCGGPCRDEEAEFTDA